MPSLKTSLISTIALAATLVAGQAATKTFPDVPLASKTFASPADLPYKVDTDVGLIRGVQHGYNICNGTTENQKSLCQTSWVNDPTDFCLWAPDEVDSVVANTEGEMVAWCTKPGHGTRLIPQGALKGLQYIRTPDYIQIVGFIDQKLINIQTDDWGGEMDPHGADLRGNPMGGVMFSNAFGGTKQVIEWTNFMGGNAFCLKACDPAGPNAARLCEHRYDRIGCAYNMPNNAVTGVFEECKGDNMDPVGVYTDAAGVVQTYTQPDEHLGAISTMPYQPKVPASSECVPITSSLVFTAGPTPTATSSSAASTGKVTTSVKSGASASASKTGSGAAASATESSAAGSVRVGGVVGLVAAVVAGLVL